MDFSLKIVSPDGPTFSGDVSAVSLPTAMGEITVLPHHVPLIAVLAPGEVRVQQANEIILLSVSSGVIEVRPDNTVYVLAETAERAGHIDIARAEAAKARAEELMQARERLMMSNSRRDCQVGKRIGIAESREKWRNVGQ